MVGWLLLAVPVAVPAQAPDPAFTATNAELYARSLQRGQDQAANPDYLQRIQPYAQAFVDYPREEANRPHDVDPFRLGWATTRGREYDLSIRNRYGARIHAHISLPRRVAKKPRPAVIALTGGAGTEHAYRGMAQGLAEAGYVVVGVSLQGDYGAQLKAPDPVPATPENEYCRPGNFGGWQDAQEMGIRELGACAGEDPVAEEPGSTLDTVALVASHGADTAALAEGYEAVKARKTFGALDVVKWLRSSLNPYRDEIDIKRVGIIGHSLGAHGALLAGNGDPEKRFKAVVTLDSFGSIAPTTTPRVPTLFEHADGFDLGPYTTQPAQASLPGHLDAPKFVQSGVPTGVVVLGGSTHQEWGYIPAPLHQAPVALNASRDGERVGLYYAQAWFDRFLGKGKTRKRATARLLARRYDGRVDRSSIGQGPYDVATQRTVSPTIGGETARHHLSPIYDSWLDLGRKACADLRSGCN